MARIVDVPVPKFPECWKSCGSCGHGSELSVDDVLRFPGDRVARDETLIVVETGKAALDIPSPVAGTLVALFVAPGDPIAEGQPLVRIATDSDGD
jgi:pyruvate/2-oxoglutarate dehydrogenase complex dihydrolipoamide acyltransferase (E2) component